jgi:hypothetical protein
LLRGFRNSFQLREAMPNILPRVPMLPDIKGMPTAQLLAYCRVYELPTQTTKIDDIRNNLRVLRLLVQGDTAMVTPMEARRLFDAWDIQGDYSTCPPDYIKVVLIGYFAALARRYQATGYCRTPLSVIGTLPTTRFTGAGECDITVTMDAVETAVSKFEEMYE